jgi:DNA polymerase (family 10)
MISRPPDNDEIADLLERIAALLEVQDANPYRCNAYRSAGRVIRETDRALSEIVRAEGTEGLQKLPGIGTHIAAVVANYVYTGRIPLLEQLERSLQPDRLFRSLPGIGPTLAARIAREHGIESLEGLELAAHDGRLESLAGFGPRRTSAVRAALASVLSRSGQRRARAVRRDSGAQPPLSAILAVDARYRERAEAGELPRIAPRRFNEGGHAWLPILRSESDGWNFTALYSNTARAHQLDRIHDWVVIHFERIGSAGQCTVVTELRGPLRGKRVVRGREAESLDYYRARPRHTQLAQGAGI